MTKSHFHVAKCPLVTFYVLRITACQPPELPKSHKLLPNRYQTMDALTAIAGRPGDFEPVPDNSRIF